MKRELESSREKQLPVSQIQLSCPLCGHCFAEADGKRACRGCPLAWGCRMIRCPNCGYDIPQTIKFKYSERSRANGTD